MKLTSIFALTLLAACGGAPAQTGASLARQAVDVVVPAALADSAAPSGFDRIADVAERAVPAVVHITSQRAPQEQPNLPFFLPFPMPDGGGQGAGSGVLVDSKGLVLTNHHVVAGAETITVSLSDGRRFSARVRGDDEATDLAILELEGKVPTDLPTLRLGDSSRLRLGEVVLAIGSPFALQGSVTMGILSARGRSGFQLARYEDYLQTDAAINPGNSGGALVDLHGNLVGINTAIRSQSGGYDGIGFAIPANLARDIMDRLLRDGKVVRGYLGVGLDDVDPNLADRFGLGSSKGALVTQVVKDSPAEQAGLRPYDVVVGLDGQPISDVNGLRHAIALKGAKAKVSLDVVRDGRPQRVQATLAALEDASDDATPSPADGPSGGLLQGLKLGDLDDEVRRQLRLDPADVGAGAVVLAVGRGTPAAAAGLAPGDVVVEVDRKPVGSAKELARALGGRSQALLLVARGGARRLVFLGG